MRPSFASAPLLQKKTRPLPNVFFTMISARRGIFSFRKRLDTCTSVCAWRQIASVTAGWQCPRLQTEMPDEKSRYLRRFASYRLTPPPRTNSVDGVP